MSNPYPSSKPASARCLAIFGTGSDVGKSIVVTALCRIFANRGINVAPFKAQNMSNNSYVTPDGGEMGRAQVVQAQAARVEPHVDMNPVLLKPSSETGAQVIVHGRAIGTFQAREYFANTQPGRQAALESLARLRTMHELLVIEGAGSCAEVNLLDRDFVNFSIAHAADAPVILVGDIDRGGIFAQLVGTLEVLPERERRRVRGLIINRFRGDATLFEDGIRWIERRTSLPVLGLIPFFRHIEIDSEDGMPLDTQIDPPQGPEAGKINIAAIRWPHISNFTDFAPLIRDSRVRFHYLARPRNLAHYDMLLLPGSKNVRADLEWLRALGWEARIKDYASSGGRIGGICGGYQMLGTMVADPDGVEDFPGETSGLGLLNVRTTLLPGKILAQVRGRWLASDAAVEGYEIHMGRTERKGAELRPAILLENLESKDTSYEDGAVSANGRVWGIYLHGLFDAPEFRAGFLHELRPELARLPEGEAESTGDAGSIQSFRDRQYDLLAEHFERHLDMTALENILYQDVPKL